MKLNEKTLRSLIRNILKESLSSSQENDGILSFLNEKLLEMKKEYDVYEFLIKTYPSFKTNILTILSDNGLNSNNIITKVSDSDLIISLNNIELDLNKLHSLDTYNDYNHEDVNDMWQFLLYDGYYDLLILLRRYLKNYRFFYIEDLNINIENKSCDIIITLVI